MAARNLRIADKGEHEDLKPGPLWFACTKPRCSPGGHMMLIQLHRGSNSVGAVAWWGTHEFLSGHLFAYKLMETKVEPRKPSPPQLG